MMRVADPPVGALATCTNAAEAELLRDWNEMYHGYACCVVTCEGVYYVVWAD